MSVRLLRRFDHSKLYDELCARCKEPGTTTTIYYAGHMWELCAKCTKEIDDCVNRLGVSETMECFSNVTEGRR